MQYYCHCSGTAVARARRALACWQPLTGSSKYHCQSQGESGLAVPGVSQRLNRTRLRLMTGREWTAIGSASARGIGSARGKLASVVAKWPDAFFVLSCGNYPENTPPRAPFPSPHTYVGDLPLGVGWAWAVPPGPGGPKILSRDHQRKPVKFLRITSTTPVAVGLCLRCQSSRHM